jgi:HAD superfamily hydrolase (TIGR01509 family)
MAKMIEALLVDIDGTAVDCEADNRRIIERVAKANGGLITPPDWKELAGTGDGIIWNWLKDKFNTFSADRNSFVQEIEEGYLTRDSSRIAAREGIVEIFNHISKKGLPLAAVTNSPRQVAMANLRNAQIDHHLQFVVSRTDVEDAGLQPKPSGDPYLMAAQRLNIKPDRCLVLEDSKTGVTAARDACMYVIQIVDSNGTPTSRAHDRAYDAMELVAKVKALVP